MTRMLNRKQLYNVFLHFAVVVLGIEVVILARQNRLLKQGPAGGVETIRTGDFFFMDNVDTLQTSIKIENTNALKVVFIFTTTCQFCEANLQYWNQIVAEMTGKGIGMVGISLDSKIRTYEYLNKHNVSFPVFCVTDRKEFSQKNNILRVPITLVLDNMQQIKNVWNGALTFEMALEVVRAIIAD